MHWRSYPLLPHVKLNTPLMGTEITYQAGGFHILTRPHVKLKAPPMGTETLFCCWSAINYKLIHFVKLNNPLVGTETIISGVMLFFFTRLLVKINEPH